MYRLEVQTSLKNELRNITREIRNAVRASGISAGVCYVFVPHTTAAVTINEAADPSVAEDILLQLDKVAPESGRYHHAEGNSPSHIKASLVGNSVMAPVENGDLALGTWQGILFCEFDGPRRRSVLVKILPDR